MPSPAMVAKVVAQAKVKAQAKKNAAQERQQKRAAAASTLIERCDILEESGAKRRKKEQQCLHTTVAKALRDNFKGWGEDLTDLCIRDGKSLRQQLLEDLLAKKNGTRPGPMGKVYYNELRNRYGNALAPEKLLAVADDTDPDDHKLLAAVTHLFVRRRSVEPLVQWLASADMINQKMLVGMFRACLGCPPSTSPENCKLGMSLMEYVVRHQVQVNYAVEAGHMTDYFNSTLSKQYQTFRKHGLTRADFWAQHQSLCKLVLPAEAAQQCFGISGSGTWAEVESHLAECVRSGSLGRALFSKAYGDVAATKASQLVRLMVDSLRGKTIKQSDIDDAKVRLSAQVKELGRDMGDAYTSPTEVTVMFLGVPVPVPVVSIHDEFMALVWAYMKTVAIVKGDLEPIFGELALAEMVALAENDKVDLSAVRDCSTVRAAAARHLDGETAINGLMVKKAIDEHGSFLLSMDRRWRIEQHFLLYMVKDGASAKFKRTVSAMLPGSGRTCTVQSALQGLVRFGQSALYDWVDCGHQAAYQRILEDVKAIAADLPPRSDPLSDPFLVTCRSAMSHWCDMPVPALPAEQEQPPIGEARALAVFEKYRALKQGGAATSVSFQAMQRLNVFSWLLSDDQKVMLAGWINEQAQDVLACMADETANPIKDAKKKQARPTSSKSQVAALFK